MNIFIKSLITASFLFEAGFGLFIPVFAVFITDQVVGGTVAVAGYAAAVYWILKSFLQIPVGRFLDRREGEFDDFWALCCGHFIMGLAVLSYLWVRTSFELYAAQVLLAAGGALSVPSWYGMFLRHVDKRKEGFEWSINSSLSFGLGTGGAGALGGFLADTYGFQAVFIGGAVFIWISALFLFVLRHRVYGRQTSVPNLPHPL